jgi:hypothetical protein
MYKTNRNLNMTMRFITRIIYKHKLEPTILKGINQKNIKYELDNIGSLVSHYDQFTSKKLNEYELLATGIKSIIETDLTTTEIILLFCISNCNSMTITNMDTSVGGGIYPQLCMINHSCDPNANITFINTRGVLKTNRKIQKGDQIYVSYLEEFLSKTRRKEICRDTYFFECKCFWCINPDEKLHLQKCTERVGNTICGKRLFDSTWKCKGGHKVISSERVLRKEMGELELSQMNITQLLETLVHYEKCLSLTHYKYFEILKCLSEQYLRDKNWKELTDISIKFSNSFRKLNGNGFRLGVLYYRVSKYAQLVNGELYLEVARVYARNSCEVIGVGSPEYESSVENLRLLSMEQVEI